MTEKKDEEEKIEEEFHKGNMEHHNYHNKKDLNNDVEDCPKDWYKTTICLTCPKRNHCPYLNNTEKGE